MTISINAGLKETIAFFLLQFILQIIAAIMYLVLIILWALLLAKLLVQIVQQTHLLPAAKAEVPVLEILLYLFLKKVWYQAIKHLFQVTFWV